MSKTDENLQEAFAGESMARNKYTYFAKVADKEGYKYIAKIFRETADNEMQHAKDHFKLMGGLGDTKENLKSAIDGEDYETTSMYPDFAKDAEEEGRSKEKAKFIAIGNVEAHHRERYKKLLDMVENDTVFKREKEINWKCSKCGHVHVGTEPPKKCPSCGHPLEYFEPECMCFEDSCEKCN